MSLYNIMSYPLNALFRPTFQGALFKKYMYTRAVVIKLDFLITAHLDHAFTNVLTEILQLYLDSIGLCPAKAIIIYIHRYSTIIRQQDQLV